MQVDERTIRITQQARDDALAYANEICNRGISNNDFIGGINGGLTIKERYYLGYLGEWVFNEFLKNQNIKDKVEWSRDSNGMADNEDFFFGEKIIDVKTASRSFHCKLMLPLSQFLKHKRDYYVSVKLNGDFGEIKGFATYEDILNTEIKNFGYGETKAIDFRKLKPINELICQEILPKWLKAKN